MISSLDDFVTKGLAVDANASAGLVRKALEELGSSSSTSALWINKDKLLGVLRMLPPDNNTLARLCVHRALDITTDHLVELYATLRDAVPCHINVALDLLCELVGRVVATLARMPGLNATRLELAAAVEGVVAKIEALGSYPDVLLPLHTHLLFLYLCSDCPERGLALAQRRFTGVYRADAYRRTVLEFHYYAGVVFAATGQFERAEQRFEVVFRAPKMLPTSWVVVFAYFKYILTALIVHGQLPEGTKLELPRRDESHDYMEYLASVRDDNNYAAHVHKYEALAALVKARNVPAVRGFVATNADVLRAYGNFGLAVRLEQRMLRHVLLSARGIYDSCSYTKMLRSAGFRSPDQSDVAQLRAAAEALQQEGVVALDVGDVGVRFHRAPLQTHDTRESALALENAVRAVHWWAASAEAKCDDLETWAAFDRPAKALSAVSLGCASDDDDDGYDDDF